jgi:hypothetical protein
MWGASVRTGGPPRPGPARPWPAVSPMPAACRLASCRTRPASPKDASGALNSPTSLVGGFPATTDAVDLLRPHREVTTGQISHAPWPRGFHAVQQIAAGVQRESLLSFVSRQISRTWETSTGTRVRPAWGAAVNQEQGRPPGRRREAATRRFAGSELVRVAWRTGPLRSRAGKVWRRKGAQAEEEARCGCDGSAQCHGRPASPEACRRTPAPRPDAACPGEPRPVHSPEPTAIPRRAARLTRLI